MDANKIAPPSETASSTLMFSTPIEAFAIGLLGGLFIGAALKLAWTGAMEVWAW